MARPSIINDQLIENFCLKLRVTGSIEAAITRTGIGRETYYRWRCRVREGRGTELEQRFMNAVDKSEREVKMRLEYQLSLHFDKKWRAIAWWLERKYPEEYGRRRPMPALEAPAEQLFSDRIVWEKPPTIKVQPALTAAKSTEEAGAGHFEAVERLSGAWVEGAFYEKLGLKPLAGRLLTADDDRLEAPLVGVLTDAYWARRFGRDLRVIGRIMRIEGVPVTIVGVSAHDFASTPVGQVADIIMAMGVMPRVPPGGGARRIVWEEQEFGEPSSSGEEEG
jgi:hypothetical protein